MATIITCPKCMAKLKAPDGLPAGRKITCSKCQQVFTSVEPTPPVSKPSDGIPEALFVDDEPLERPPTKRPRDDDDDIDDRPRARRRRDDDDRPRARKRRDDDDSEHDERPTRRARKRVHPALLAGGVVGAVLLLLGGGVLFYVLSRGGSASGADLVGHLPSDAVVVSGYDVEVLTANFDLKRTMDQSPPADLAELDRAGLRMSELTHVLVAITPNNGKSCAVRFKTNPKQDLYLNAKVSGKNYSTFKSLSGSYQYGYFAASNVLVLADREPTIQAVYDANGKSKLSTNLQAMMSRTRGPVWRASGPLTTPTKIGGADDAVAFRVGASQGSASWMTLEGLQGQVQLVMEFQDELQATQAAAILKGLFKMLEMEHDFGRMFGKLNGPDVNVAEIRRGYAEATVDVSGRTVTAKMQLPANEAMRIVSATR